MAVAGEIDFSNSDALRAMIDAAIDEPGRTLVEVDLDRLTFIDSSGIRALLAGKRAAGQRGIAFEVHNPTRGVLRVLQLLGVDGMLGPA
jgi:anti-anti-sigma factor